MARLVHSTKFPGESNEYRRSRDALLRDEIKLRRLIESVAAKRRSLPLGGDVRTDYEFDGVAVGDSNSRTIRLSELFMPGKRTLFIYNFMFPEAVGSMTPCPSCTSIIDAIDAATRHIVDRINFAWTPRPAAKPFSKSTRRPARSSANFPRPNFRSWRGASAFPGCWSTAMPEVWYSFCLSLVALCR